ncbi:hypothetical protein [Pleomorphomonas sp. JP5]|uniref:hypothetical protein n=1 Tax=Pleomorphomonas sp. JP5 TaxID=2942998 RepID=UPI002042FCE3|nr:hypothetical protein [Pleomorphomonas sp. JP5]MCM5558680.1 hypothetical protein [Pleomorphomonas sp. JP5]
MRIAVSIEYPKLRAKVDRRLKIMLRQDDLGLLEGGPRIVEVSGPRAQRKSPPRAFADQIETFGRPANAPDSFAGAAAFRSG